MCLQRSQGMQRAGTLRCQAHHSCSLSWVWDVVSPPPSPTAYGWSTPQTVVVTGLSSPQSVCPQQSGVPVTLRVPSIPQPSTNTGGGSLSTCPALLSMCFWTFIPKISGQYLLKVHNITYCWIPQFPQNSVPLDPDPFHPRGRRMGSR